MPIDLVELLRTRHGENYALHEKHLNHQLGRVLKTIGFDRFYVRGEGCYLYDAEGERYLDFLSGIGVYALGRANPRVKAVFYDAIDLDLPEHGPDGLCAPPGSLGRTTGGAMSRRNQPGLLHQLWRRSHRVGHQVRPTGDAAATASSSPSMHSTA